MLTDIFAERYAAVFVWQAFGDAERKLLVQSFRIVSEQLFPYWTYDGKERDGAKAQWKSMHDRLSMELGLNELAAQGYWAQRTAAFPNGYWVSLAPVQVCKNFVCGDFDGSPADQFIKQRLSFVEIAFRDRETALTAQNEALPGEIARAELSQARNPVRQGIVVPGNRADGLRAMNVQANQSFRASVDELNERLRRAGTRLTYHNGFVQIVEDELAGQHIEKPFWALVADPKWANVDTDMKEAIDRRDANGRDPVLYAAKALESTIKIISDDKGWTRGGERGAHAYIDNLAAAANGQFISRWEQSALKAIFSDLRNDFGHGPGNAPMPQLTPEQTSWAIESCMSWIRSLIRRI